ncbi:ribonuclease E [Striga asiatica]|uniref:Ribonuclease E n=1 Tax=Striga asiatica TaxID=4170 RepID=A0A5A7R4S6_STRAF|nr:ribonuclease E [Striga asiatica]
MSENSLTVSLGNALSSLDCSSPLVGAVVLDFVGEALEALSYANLSAEISPQPTSISENIRVWLPDAVQLWLYLKASSLLPSERFMKQNLDCGISGIVLSAFSASACELRVSVPKIVMAIGEITRGIKCNCFMKEDMLTSSDILWRPGVQFLMPAHSPSQRYKKRTTKLRSHDRRRQVAHLYQSLMDNRDYRLFIPPLLRDERETVKSHPSGSLASKFFCGVRNARKKSHLGEAFSTQEQLIEEPWLSQPSIGMQRAVNSYTVIDNGMQKSELLNQSSLSEDFSHKLDYDEKGSNSSESENTFLMNYLVEEPWIFDSFAVTSGTEIVSSAFSNESSEDKVTLSVFDEQQKSIPENLLHERKSNMTSKDSVSTVILINSSVCTVQRIAVLENDQLVELLLEPVETKVQCGNVYLGVVTQLAPNMGGAFVNIGSPRACFMDIKFYRKPFILPFSHSPMKEREVRAPMFDKSGVEVDFPQTGAFFSGVEESDEVECDQSEDEFEGEENHFHCDDVLDTIKESVNGGVVRHGSEVDTQKSLEQLNGDLEQLNGDVEQLGARTGDLDANSEVLSTKKTKWAKVKKGSKIIVQVIKEGLGTKSPTLTAYPKLSSRFWVLSTCVKKIGVSKKISGAERKRLRTLAETLRPPGFGLTVRTAAYGHSLEELQKDLEGLLSTWKNIVDHAISATLAADEGIDGAVPVMLHKAMGQTLSVVRDIFNKKVKSMVVDSPRTYHEVTNYLQDIDPNLCERVELYSKRTPIFDEYNIEEEINNILSKRVRLANGGYLVIEQTEALVSIDVNGGQGVLGQGTSQEKAVLKVNLAAAKQIARELRLRDIGGIIVVDFIDMRYDVQSLHEETFASSTLEIGTYLEIRANRRKVYQEVKKAVKRDRSKVDVRPSVSFMISEPCTYCHATGRVEALDTSFSKIEHEICRLLATTEQKAEPENPKTWPRFVLRVNGDMCKYMTTGRRTRLAVLSSSLKVWILLKVARGFSRGVFELKLLLPGEDADGMHENQAIPTPIAQLKDVITHSSTKPPQITIFPMKNRKPGLES